MARSGKPGNFGNVPDTFGEIGLTFGEYPDDSFSYTNQKKNVLDQLEVVIESAKLPAQIRWNLKQYSGSEIVVIRELPDETLLRMGGAETRRLEFEVSYYLNVKPTNYKTRFIDLMTRRIEKIKRVLNDNTKKSVNDELYWFDGEITDAILDDTLNEDEEKIGTDYKVGRINFECTTMEVFE